MNRLRTKTPHVTLMLQTPRGESWPLTLSSDCLLFIGRYRRLEGFDIDATLLFQGGDRIG